MSIIKIFFILFSLFGLSRIFVRVRKRELSYALAVLGVIIWACVIIFALWPELLNRLADLVGIGRGVDTAVYISIVVIFYLVFRVFVRLEKMEDHLTTIVRQNALKDFVDEKRKEQSK